MGSKSGHEDAVHRYDLHRGGRVIGCLEWHAQWGEATGWYLRRGSGRARRLAVDVGPDRFDSEHAPEREDWRERAVLAATLSIPLALDAADRALRGGLPPPPSRPLEPGAYEMHVTGLDPTTLAITCPSVSAVAAGDTSVIDGIFDDDAIRAVITRINLLGGRVLAIFRGRSRA